MEFCYELALSELLTPSTGKSTLAYTQHDTGFQAILISERLKIELGLGVKREPVVTRALADQTTKSCSLTDVNLHFLYDYEVYRTV